MKKIGSSNRTLDKDDTHDSKEADKKEIKGGHDVLIEDNDEIKDD